MFSIVKDFEQAVAGVSFAYSMHGAGTGTLRLEASADNTAPFTLVWSKRGADRPGWATAVVPSVQAEVPGARRLRFWYVGV